MKGTVEPLVVLRRTMEVLGADLAAYVLLSLVLVGAPTLLSDSVLADVSEPAVIFGASLLQVLLIAIVLHNALARLSGAPVPVLRSLAPGLKFWLLAFAVELVTGVAVLCGLALLIVPGMILALRWLIPLPAMMSENLGIGAGLRRSSALTEGNRMALLGPVLAWVALFMLLPLTLIRAMQQQDVAAWAIAAVDMVGDMAGVLTSAAGVAVIYTELRRLKEAPKPSIFG